MPRYLAHDEARALADEIECAIAGVTAAWAKTHELRGLEHEVALALARAAVRYGFDLLRGAGMSIDRLELATAELEAKLAAAKLEAAPVLERRLEVTEFPGAGFVRPTVADLGERARAALQHDADAYAHAHGLTPPVVKMQHGPTGHGTDVAAVADRFGVFEALIASDPKLSAAVEAVASSSSPPSWFAAAYHRAQLEDISRALATDVIDDVVVVGAGSLAPLAVAELRNRLEGINMITWYAAAAAYFETAGLTVRRVQIDRTTRTATFEVGAG